MSDSEHMGKTLAASEVSSGVLPESARQQYLNAMGIQTWYDPALEFEPPESPVNVDANIPVEQNQPLAQANDVAADSSAHTETAQVSSLDELTKIIDQCQLCELHTSRKQAIAGEGQADANLMIITDAPLEDNSGNTVLFIEQHKKMLQAMLRAIEIDLSSSYLTSLVKCQPPQQRAPHTSEMICCDDHLSAQIKQIQPDAILILGEKASQQLLVSQKTLMDLRLRQHQHLGVPVFVSYHPQELFSNADTKRKVWQDLLQIKSQLV